MTPDRDSALALSLMDADITSNHWLASLAALLIVIGFLMIAAALQEWRQWRKGG